MSTPQFVLILKTSCHLTEEQYKDSQKEAMKIAEEMRAAWDKNLPYAIVLEGDMSAEIIFAPQSEQIVK